MFYGYYRLTPQPDITAFEIAKFLASCGKVVSEGTILKLPPEMKRHFTRIT